MSLLKRYGRTCRICWGQKPANQGDSEASPASPVQAVGTKIIFLASSKDEDYTDIDLIHYILVFRNGNFSPRFFPVINLPIFAQIVLRIILIRQRFIFEEK